MTRSAIRFAILAVAALIPLLAACGSGSSSETQVALETTVAQAIQATQTMEAEVQQRVNATLDAGGQPVPITVPPVASLPPSGGSGSSPQTVQPPTPLPATSTPIPTQPLPTVTPLPTATPMPQVPVLNFLLEGCDTGFDIMQGLGEVTNAYVLVQNVGTGEATNLCAELQPSDVGQSHPDQTRCIQHLLPGKEVYFKLTADTEFQTGTSINIVLTSDNGLREETGRGNCREIDPNLLDRIDDFILVPVDF